MDVNQLVDEARVLFDQVGVQVNLDVRSVVGAPGVTDIWFSRADERGPDVLVSHAKTVAACRILVASYVFEEVLNAHVPEFVRKVMSGKYELNARKGLIRLHRTLSVDVGGSVYAAMTSGIADDWEAEALEGELPESM